MFGELMGMMGKLKEAQKKVKATREHLSTIEITEESDSSGIRVTLTANREIREISIDEQLFYDKLKLETELKNTLNKALQRAGEIHDKELKAVAKEHIPNIPGMDAFLK